MQQRKTLPHASTHSSIGSEQPIFELGKETEEKEPSLFLRIVLSLRTKTCIILLLLFALSTAVILAILLGVLPQSFVNVERILAQDAALRVSRHLHEEMNAVALKLLDYAIWVCFASRSNLHWQDDTYAAFVNYTEGQADTYWTDNMNCEYMTNVLKQNFVLAFSTTFVQQQQQNN